ncbi:hypothetical protein [Pseudoalteromonas sp. Of7M-16]|uniref:helix-turn-helix transcriptional regulator n=1 Tax=Pseudoalteromonas sp. Of7M-16 TaxID=2917756 RepID=UPI001EF59B67|nr:hypothetical protein [Pseudoalteromonas sp. Of7M-16]MCG7548233.1 hypothetical protein [Pseudoalteromonas sp. Of7M-16]
MAEQDFYTVIELAERLDCSVSGINLKLKNEPDFPKPIPTAKRAVRKWRKRDIDIYLGVHVEPAISLEALPPQLIRALSIVVQEAVQKGLNDVMNAPRHD